MMTIYYFGKGVAIFAAFLGIIFFNVPSSAEKAPYKSFAKDARFAPATSYYDYIIIGGGTAGCPLAATLSSGAKVLLLERGGLPYNNPNITYRAGFERSLQDTSGAAQMFISTDGVINHRGRVLGGSSAINAGFYTHASSEFVQKAGWDPQLVKESYAWVERKVAFRPRLAAWQATARDGLLESGVLPDNGFTYDHLQGTKIGGSIFDQNGVRHSAADLLEYANATNINLYFHAVVHQIIFNNIPGATPKGKAYGVVFKDTKGETHVARLKSGALDENEIILSSGAIGSPQILMLSGIGPAQKLKSHGISVVLDQPLVGQGLADNPRHTLIIPSPSPVEFSILQVVGINDSVGSYLEIAYSGFIHSYHLQDYAHLLNQSIESLTIPTNRTMSKTLNGSETGTLFVKIAGPFSTGYMELQSKDPNENPKVTFNYFKDDRDLKRCVGGMKMMKGLVESPSLSKFRGANTSFESLVGLVLSIPINLRTKHPNATHSMEQFCKDTVTTIWHYHGGCQVDRVVDRDYKVIGVDSLRVVDGSTFHESPGTNPQATVMMLGRYMGTQILRKRNSQKGSKYSN